MLSSTGHDNVEIQVDGNVSFEHIPAMVAAGATMLVGGTSSIFHKDYSIAEAVAAVREICERGRSSPMMIVHSYPIAVALCVLTMMCWGSHANTLKMEPRSYAFPLYYWDQAIGYLLLPLLAGLTFGSFGSGGRTLLDDLAQGSMSSYEWAILGGFVFNLANILFTSAIHVAGMAVAFPIGIGIALVEGVVINYIAQPKGNPVLIFTGVALIALAIVLDALAYRNQQGEESEPGELAKGVSLALAGGVLMGLFYYLVQRSISVNYSSLDPGKFGPYAAVLVFAAGSFSLQPGL